MLKVNSVMIGSADANKLKDFYEKVFDKKIDMDDNGFFGWVFGEFFIGIGNHSEVSGENKEPARVIFNLDTKEVKEEFERIKSLGTKVIKEPYEIAPGYWIATFADPDGNYFQLTTPWDGN